MVSAGRSDNFSSTPSQNKNKRSTTFSSSRMLPDQGCDVSPASAAGSTPSISTRELSSKCARRANALGWHSGSSKRQLSLTRAGWVEEQHGSSSMRL